jgi:hypothetical protein
MFPECCESFFLEARRLSPSDAHYFFGYYDLPAWSPDGRRHLAHRVEFMDRLPRKEDRAQVGVLDAEKGGTFGPLAETRAWNFQQGAMLQWLPGAPERVLFNQWLGDRVGAVVLETASGRRREFGLPAATVSPDGRSALSVHFGRMLDFRAGYGYAGLADPRAGRAQPEDDGIHRLDVQTGETRLLAPLSELGRMAGFDREKKLLVNHVNFNPDGSRFVFLLRDFPQAGRPWATTAMSLDAEGNDPRILVDRAVASHYHWRDAQMLAMVAAARGEVLTLRIYNTLTGDAWAPSPSFFVDDGHCSFSPGGDWLLYDSYPREGMRYLSLWHLREKRGWCLGAFRTTPMSTPLDIDIRCDLHPRWSPDGLAVSFDSIHEGMRGIYRMDLEPFYSAVSLPPSS